MKFFLFLAVAAFLCFLTLPDRTFATTFNAYYFSGAGTWTLEDEQGDADLQLSFTVDKLVTLTIGYQEDKQETISVVLESGKDKNAIIVYDPEKKNKVGGGTCVHKSGTQVCALDFKVPQGQVEVKMSGSLEEMSLPGQLTYKDGSIFVWEGTMRFNLSKTRKCAEQPDMDGCV